MESSSSRAPGAPGGPSLWNAGSKVGTGTAAQKSSNVWFTLGRGSVEEVYFPGPDHPRIRLCGLAVANGSDFYSWEKTDAESEAGILEEGVPAYRLTNRCKNNRYRIEKEVIAHPELSALLQRTRFFSKHDSLQLYVYLNPHLGKEARAWLGEFRGQSMLFAQGDSVAVAMASSAPLLGRSVGFFDTSDGLKDLEQHKMMSWKYELAEGGNVAMTAQLDYPQNGGDFLLVIGFGFDPEAAALNAHAALLDGFEKPCMSYCSAWKEWQSRLSPLDDKNNRDVNLYRASTAVIRTHQAKMPPGTIVASITVPFGQIRVGLDTGGYHLVWPRDLVETAGALLAAGDGDRVRDVLVFLEATQMPDGHWPQTMWLNGLPYFNGIQMDETAMAVLLVEHCRHEKNVFKPGEEARFWPMIKKAAGYLVRKGPYTPEDRWENASGYSPFTMGAEIGALLAAADMAVKNGESALAEYLRETSDIWNASIERRTYSVGGEYAKKAGVEGYYIRLGQPTGKAGGLASEKALDHLRKQDLPSTDALALVRFGLRSPHDPRMVNTVKVIDALLKVDIGYGPGWRRYLGDHYGEYPDGRPFDNQGGVGRAWPLFIGERAHFEIGAGRFQEAEKLLRLMEKTATNTGLISEQTWDADDIPSCGLYRGKPTTSACPLVWAHAEYVKLLRSLRDKKIFDCPRQTVERYGKGFTPSKKRIWSFHNPIEEIAEGESLRIEVLAPAVVRWTDNHWKTDHEEESTDTGLNLFMAELPTKRIASGREVEFTFHWTEVNRWENKNFKVTVREAE